MENCLHNSVSVIVPVYNAEKSLSRCIESVLEQSFTDFELLLINDGSKDKSGEICDGYAANDSRVRVFHKDNGGASAARNYGLDKATGKYICFIDADDWVDKDYIESLLPTEGEEIVVCSIVYEGNSGYKLILWESLYQSNVLYKHLDYIIEQMSVCSPCCKILRRDIIEENKIRFDVNVSAGEDMLFVYDYFSAGLDKIRTISQPLYHYYVADSGSLSHRIVDFATTEYVLWCIKERIDKLSWVYNWNGNDSYKRLICTQLNNMVTYARNRPSFFERLKYMKRTVDNPHIRVLLSDVDYMVKRKRLNGIKAFAFRISMLPLRLYYCFKRKTTVCL